MTTVAWSKAPNTLVFHTELWLIAPYSSCLRPLCLFYPRTSQLHLRPDCPHAHHAHSVQLVLPSLRCSVKQHWCYRLNFTLPSWCVRWHCAPILSSTSTTSCANALQNFPRWERPQKSGQLTPWGHKGTWGTKTVLVPRRAGDRGKMLEKALMWAVLTVGGVSVEKPIEREERSKLSGKSLRRQ